MLSFEDTTSTTPERDDSAAAEPQAADGRPAEDGTSPARVLELAAQTADQLVSDARTEAASLVAAAHAEADDARRVLAEEKAGLEAQIEALRRQQDNHRTQLREHLAHQLSLLDTVQPEPPAGFTDPGQPGSVPGPLD